MPAHCNPDRLRFEAVSGRRVEAAFDGGVVTSDGGGLLLGLCWKALSLGKRFAACFRDRRDPDLVEHSVETLLRQRVMGLAMGYEDLNDHEALRRDPVMALLAEKLDARRADCQAVAGKSTLNRLELSGAEATRYHKIGHDGAAIERLLVDLFLESRAEAPDEIVLDFDATDDPLHGDQEGRFFHGYYDCHCYLPLYVFCGRDLLAAKLRRADIDGSAGAKQEAERIVARIRERWPMTRIILRADSGFAREELMAWCEANGVDFLFGLARNERLAREIAAEMEQARLEAEATAKPARRFKDFVWTTQKSWSRERRVVGKAEWLGDKANPRFVVTSLAPERACARELYEDIYCARGDMENRIKEAQGDLFGDRTSTRAMRSNQLRLWFSSMAYALLSGLRRIALAGTILAAASCASLRLKLLKIGATVTRSTRRVRLAMASGFPLKEVFAIAHGRLAAAARA
ncbi:MAG: IS1380 family transposase [Rhizobiales bacterium]|nr:IS1380 family transposase [Hyphomicrobiales bacterium]